MTTQKGLSYEDVQRHLTVATKDRGRVQATTVSTVGRLVLHVTRFTFRIMVETGRARIEDMRRARRRKETLRTLSGLSDHVLIDIGINRSEITSVALEVSSSQWPSRPASLRSRIAQTGGIIRARRLAHN